MIPCVCISLLAVLAAPQSDAPAKERTTYIIATPEGKLPVYWDEAKIQEGQDWVRVEVDEPWAPRIWQGKRSSVTVEGRERKAAAQERLKKGYEEHGYIEVNGRFALQSEVALAERARKMAGLRPPSAADPAPSATAAPTVTEPNTPTPKEHTAPSLVKQWGPEAGVVIVALLLLAVVAKMLLARG